MGEFSKAKIFEDGLFKIGKLERPTQALFDIVDENTTQHVDEVNYFTYDVETYRHIPLLPENELSDYPKVAVLRAFDKDYVPNHTDIKAFIVSDPKAKKLELKGVLLEDSVLIPFTPKYVYFGFNPGPVAVADEVKFTNKVDDILHVKATQFE